MNSLFERWGRLGNSFLGGATTNAEFIWTCCFGRKHYCLPVHPDLPRSWGGAKQWTVPKFSPFRRYFEFLFEYMPPGCYLDLGANDGHYTFPFAVHGYQCACFEPQSSCVTYIQRVCDLNQFSNVTVVPAVIGDQDGGSVDFYGCDDTWYGSVIRDNVEKLQPAYQISAQAVSIDGYCSREGIVPDIIKIDVEGWEWQALRGGTKILEQYLPTVIIEVFTEPDQRSRIWGRFEELGYRCYLIPYNTKSSQYRSVSPVHSQDMFVSTNVTNFVFVKNSKLLTAMERKFGACAN